MYRYIGYYVIICKGVSQNSPVQKEKTMLQSYCACALKLPGSNAIKLYTMVIYNQSTLVLPVDVREQYYNGKYHWIAVSYHANVL